MLHRLFIYSKTITLTVIAISLAIASSQTNAQVITFEELSLGSPGDGSTAYGGPGGRYFWNGSNNSGGFSSGGAQFANSYTDYGGGFYYWEGFAYSNTTDTTTEGFTNQYSSITGGGVGGSSSYGIGYQPYGESAEWAINYSGDVDMTGAGLSLTNTTYAYFSMLNGDGYAKKFGGLSGNDADWFLLTITGWNNGVSTGTVDFYLADYRFADNSQDYIVDDWTFVDLSSLGSVDKIGFDLTSSDTDPNPVIGMKTPAYVAIDNVSTVPEPSALALIPCALLVFGASRKRQRRNLR